MADGYPPVAVAPHPRPAEIQPTVLPRPALLIPVGAGVAVLGACLPWFAPYGTYRGQRLLQAAHTVYSWGGWIGLMAPIALSVVAFGIIGLLRGHTSGRMVRGADPLTAAGTRVLMASVVSAFGLAFAWEMIPQQFQMPSSLGGNWQGAVRAGIDMSRNAQFGFYLTAAAVLLTAAGGISLRSAARKV